jgi:uncharacterized protein (TIGR03435 family)
MEHISMDRLATTLSRSLHAPVVDETGVADLFTFQLDWTLENLSANPQPGDPRDGPSLFTALQETLGLKLEARKVPTEVLIIDSAEKPNVD